MSYNKTEAVNKTRESVHGFDADFHAVLIIIALLIIVSNSLVIVSFVTKETLRKGGKLLLLSLAISDVTTGLVTIPLNIGCEVTYALKYCMASGIQNRFLAISTVYHILAITLETYYAILCPMEHRVNVEKKKVFGIIIVIWLCALIIATAPLTWTLGVVTGVSEKPNGDLAQKFSIYEIFVMTFGFLLPLVLMVFAHARMFSKIINALKLLRRQSSPSHRSFNTNTNKYKAAVLFALLLLIFTICWLPWFVISLINTSTNLRVQIPLWATDTVTIIRYLTSFLNPLLYTFFRPDFYAALKSLFNRNSKRTSSLTLTYLLGGSHRTKRDSQTMTSFVREQSTSSKLIEKDSKVWTVVQAYYKGLNI